MRPFLDLRDLSFEPERDHIGAVAAEWILRGVIANRHDSLPAKRVVVELLLYDAPGGAPARTEAEIALHTVAPGEAARFWLAVARVPRAGYVRWEARVAEARSPLF